MRKSRNSDKKRPQRRTEAQPRNPSRRWSGGNCLPRIPSNHRQPQNPLLRRRRSAPRSGNECGRSGKVRSWFGAEKTRTSPFILERQEKDFSDTCSFTSLDLARHHCSAKDFGSAFLHRPGHPFDTEHASTLPATDEILFSRRGAGSVNIRRGITPPARRSRQCTLR